MDAKDRDDADKVYATTVALLAVAHQLTDCEQTLIVASLSAALMLELAEGGVPVESVVEAFRRSLEGANKLSAEHRGEVLRLAHEAMRSEPA